MFRVVTLEDWTDVLYIQMYGSDKYVGYDEQNHTGIAPVSSTQPFAAVLFFFSFVLLGTIVILNLVIGVIISSMQEAQHEREQQLMLEQQQAGTALSVADQLRLLENELDQLGQHLSKIRRQISREETAEPIHLTIRDSSSQEE